MLPSLYRFGDNDKIFPDTKKFSDFHIYFKILVRHASLSWGVIPKKVPKDLHSNEKISPKTKKISAKSSLKEISVCFLFVVQ